MKDALRQLPLEVWVDVFRYPWASREQFGKMVAEVGNYAFARSAQFYLHDWGRRKFPEFVYFDQKGLFIREHGSPVYLGIPQTPLPPNIRYLGNILITHIHPEIVEFLDKVRPLLHHELDVARVSPSRSEDLRTFLTSLLPFLDGTQSMWCNPNSLPVVQQSIPAKFAELRVVKYLNDWDTIDEALMQQNVNLLMNWLTQPNGSRLCDFRACFNINRFCEQILKAVREQFATATSPSTFAVNLIELQTAEFQKVNNIGEELHGEWTDDGFLITRHSANSNKEQLEEWIGEVTKYENRVTHDRILINLRALPIPTTGQEIDATQIVLLVDEEQPNRKKLLERMVDGFRRFARWLLPSHRRQS